MRPKDAHTKENLDLAKQIVEKLYEQIFNSSLWVCLDETHWDIGYITRVRSVGWGKKGEKTIISTKAYSFRATTITAISNSGRTFCLLVKGNVKKEIFNQFLNNMLDSFYDEGNMVVCLARLDNYSIHGDTKSIIESYGHSVIFNAPGMPELCPIERIFNIWKSDIEKSAR